MKTLTTNPVSTAVAHARAASRFAVWATQQAERFPWSSGYYLELANNSRRQAQDHLQFAWRMKADIAREAA